MVKDAKEKPSEAFFQLVSVVNDDRLQSFITELSSHNKMEQKVKQIIDLTLPYVGTEFEGVIIVADTCRNIAKRSMEALLVEVFGDNTGNVQWVKLF